MNELFVKIRFLLPSLPRAEKAIAKVLLENPDAITHLTLAEIAQESGSSEASIIRFCKRMGYTGYSALKEEFIRALAEGNESHAEGINMSDDMVTILKKVFQSNVQTLRDTLVLSNENYEKALDAILKAQSIHFFGVGDAHAVCQLAYMKFNRLGLPGSAHSDVMQQMIAAGNLTKDDVAIAISYEGRSKNVVEAMKIAKEQGATTIGITKMNKSPLLRYTDISLFIAVTDLTIGREKVTRRVADQFIMDALFLGYTTRLGKSYKEQMAKSQRAIDHNKI